MRFIVELHQDGGCDYTIGCGTKIVPLKAVDRTSALREVQELLADRYTGEYSVARAHIYAVAEDFPADVGAIYKAIAAERQAEQDEEKEEEERAEYERLRQKFGK